MSESIHLPEPEIFFGPPARQAQIDYAKRLALRTGGTYPKLQSVAHAIREIERLKELDLVLAEQLRDQDQEISVAMQTEFGGASGFKRHEVEDQGSSARWSSKVDDDEDEDGHWS